MAEYDQTTAFHYAAFRPALHERILQEALASGAEYRLGLDVGCGTGQSAVALTNVCREVIGIEPSAEMLDKAMPHPSVRYQLFDGSAIPFPPNHFDLITFAGSLYYAKSQQMLDEVVRVSQDAAQIVIYDFELRLDVFLEKLLVDSASKPPIGYDHQVNFDGLNQIHVTGKQALAKTLSVDISLANISHLLLSSKDTYRLLSDHFWEEDLYQNLSRQLQAMFQAASTLVEANIYSTVYQVGKANLGR